jgi:hypothetical protein
MVSSHSPTKQLHGNISQHSEASCSVKLKCCLHLMSRSKIDAPKFSCSFKQRYLNTKNGGVLCSFDFVRKQSLWIASWVCFLNFFSVSLYVSVLGLHGYSHKCIAYFLTYYGDQTRCTHIDIVGQQ